MFMASLREVARPRSAGPGVRCVAMRSRVRDPSRAIRSGSTASAAACSRQRARDLRVRRGGPVRGIERVASRVRWRPPERAARMHLRARSSEIGFAAMPDTSESGPVCNVTVAGASNRRGCRGDERVIEARLSSDRYLDAGCDPRGVHGSLLSLLRVRWFRRVHAGHHVIADPRRPGGAVKPASPERGRSEAKRLDGPEGRPTIRRSDGPAWCHARTPSAICAVSVPASRKLK